MRFFFVARNRNDIPDQYDCSYILINLLILANRDSSTWMQYKLARDTRQHADNLTDSMNRSSYIIRILKNTEEEI